MTTMEHSIVSKLGLQLCHILVVIESRSSDVLQHIGIYLGLLWVNSVLTIIELTSWTQSLNVVGILHFEIWAGCVWWHHTSPILLFVLVLLVEDKHLQHILSVHEFVL